MNTDLEPRLMELEDIEGVRRSKALYAMNLDELVNGGGQPAAHKLVAQFTPDAVWECQYFGHFQGQDEIGRFFSHYRGRVSFCLHYILGHVVTVAPDRSTAQGRWISWEPMTVDGMAVLLAGHYDDVLEMVGNVWLFKSVRLDVSILTPYQRGWGDRQIMADWSWPGSSPGPALRSAEGMGGTS